MHYFLDFSYETPLDSQETEYFNRDYEVQITDYQNDQLKTITELELNIEDTQETVSEHFDYGHQTLKM